MKGRQALYASGKQAFKIQGFTSFGLRWRICMLNYRGKRRYHGVSVQGAGHLARSCAGSAAW
ncbi:MAG: hypothetical protein JNL88_12325 [Bacteroidia bacterium]|nr:hypothetical protein [Bacteroidia bacterium]